MNPCCRWTVRLLVALLLSVLLYRTLRQIDAWKVAIESNATVRPLVSSDNTLSLQQAERPQRQTFNVPRARYLADLVARMYSKGKVAAPPTVRLLQPLSDHTGTPVGAVYVTTDNPATAVVAFRGTENFSEWILDLSVHQGSFSPFHTLTDFMPRINMLLSPWRYYKKRQHRAVPVPALMESQSEATRRAHRMRVHHGFYQAYRRVQPALMKALDDMQCQQLYITGHSLGGALAVIAATDVVLNVASVRQVSVYTFGAPRVGNPEFGDVLRGAPALVEFFQVQNNADLVPTVPFAVMPDSSDPQHPNYYEHAGTPVVYSANWGSFLANHELANYMHALNDDGTKLYWTT